MADPHVLTALIDRHRRVAGELIQFGKKAEVLRSNLEHLDAAIRMFKADWDAGKLPPIRPFCRNETFRQGELPRLAFDILRTANEPLTTREVVGMALERKGVAEPNRRIMTQLGNSLNWCLARREKRGLVVSQVVEGKKRWSVVK